MIIIQTPLRISFFGGGTDFASFYQGEGGVVLSSAIDKYIFVTVKPRFDKKLRVGYTMTEMADNIDEIHHELIRESLRKTGITEGIEITTMGDIPSAGSGLGSSSTVTVGALHALYTLQGEIVPAKELAKQACEIEIDVLGKPIGIQDQYIAAFGGLRLLEISPEGEVSPRRIVLDPSVERTLNENLMLFYTGISRKSARILSEQKNNTHERIAILRELKQMAYVATQALQVCNLDDFGWLLDESWRLKKSLASQISNDTIDELYSKARAAGALGGKITGAGGGGFLLLYCPHEFQNAVRQALEPLQELPFRFEHDGSKVIFNYHR